MVNKVHYFRIPYTANKYPINLQALDGKSVGEGHLPMLHQTQSVIYPKACTLRPHRPYQCAIKLLSDITLPRS